MGENLITGSIVTYHNSKCEINKVIQSFLGNSIESILFIIDNSSDNSLSSLCTDPRIRYIFNNKNLGFGTAHNIAFEEAYKVGSKYHFLLNPDIYFNNTIIQDLVEKANTDSSIGLLMPKIIYPNGETQYLCKLLPTPIDLIIRRFVPIERIKNILKKRYELRFMSYEEETEIPCLSGCFMLIRSSILEEVKGFDERYFMYLEDVDLCRKIGNVSKLIYYPNSSVVHNYEKGSYKNKKLLNYHINSAVKYFNKWGWLFDKKRKITNKRTLQRLNYKK